MIIILGLLIFQVTLSKIWAFLATIFIVTAPFANEIWDIYKAFFKNARVKTYPGKINADTADTSKTSHDLNTQNYQSGEKKRSESDEKLTDVENVHLSAFTPFKPRESNVGLVMQRDTC